MRPRLALALALAALPVVFSAPTTNSEIFAQDARDAQKLNTSYRTIKADDPCPSGEAACVDNAIARCIKGRWDTSQTCGLEEKCFAVPSLKNGLLLACTTESNALKAFEEANVEGGIFGPEDTNSTVSSSPSETPTSPCHTPIVEKTTTVTVEEKTVTVTAQATVTTTVLPPLVTSQTTVTSTIPLQEASSILSSIRATYTGVEPTAFSSIGVSSEAASSSPTASQSIILLTAAPASATASVSASAVPAVNSVKGPGYGY
ncbi:hypothetical protein CC1G_11327 [Coprinopsis cinerea okayama7|uniref:Uncharacterized protein n=1 Tax=Coprinopsis cinerea (strain Okayama-7 / 130 / ATCC MYA-4618 / FGSC 9003) TaxID=240176 RepID=A8P5R3_COPC7|nr:hypothetical protein CC1G_11327 [Coprinopsis cinerea okayama7\|eukprot:XP_001839004.1 hypothetical protein CC1G_11327 [Coprinopsis cinerea okayama7\